MAKQRIVNTRFWRDDYVLELSPQQKLLFLWAITNPETELCGAYQAAVRSIEMETGLKRKAIVEIFEKFEADGKMLYRDGWVVVMNFSRHQNGTSTNIKKGIERTLSGCPDWVKDTLSKGMHSDRYQNAPRPRPRPRPVLVLSELNNPQEGGDENLKTEIGVWMDNVARTCGAKSVGTLPKRDKWAEVVTAAVREQRDLLAFLDVIKAEDPRYLTPERCLQKLQMADTVPKVARLPTVEEKEAEEERARAARPRYQG